MSYALYVEFLGGRHLIDFNLEIKNVQPINIESMELNQSRINDNIRKSIILYNKSIIEIKTNDLDLAINDLKKALLYNRDFSEAIKLLGLCYIKIKKYGRAEKAFKKLAKYEIYDGLVEDYLKNLIIERTMTKTMEDITRVNSSFNKKDKQYILNGRFRKKLIVGFSILIIAVVGFTITHWVASNLQNDTKKVEAVDTVADSEQNKILVEKDTLLSEDYKNIEQKLDNTKSELNYYKNKYDVLSKLNEVEKSFSDGNYEEAANMLLDMKDMRFDKLWANIKQKAIWTIYNQGNRLYKDGKYQEALPKLKLAFEFEPSQELMPWVTYQIGICYKETNDNANALVFFQEVKDKYPKSKYASNSERMIKQIGNK
jgi:tetratricopeptide (TPR) repeat protein